MTIDDLIKILTHMKCRHAEGGDAEVYFEIPKGANGGDYADIVAIDIGECNAVLLK